MKRWFGIVAMVIGLSVPGCIVRTTAVVASYPVPDVSGTYQTYWGSNVATLSLQQSGARVVGNYVTTGAPPGSVDGTLDGNVVTGRWWDQGGSVGGFQFVYAPDGRSFQGTWGMGNSFSSGGNWNGSR